MPTQGRRCEAHQAETRLACAKCGAAICPQCLVRIEVGLRCGECAVPAGPPVGTGSRRRYAIPVGLASIVLLVGVVAVVLTGESGSEQSFAGDGEEAPASAPSSASPVGDWTTFEVPAALRARAGLAVDGDGAAWTASPGGVARFDGRERTVYTAEDGLAYPEATAVATGDDGTVWAATVDHATESDGSSAVGLSRLDGERWTSWTTGDGLPAAVVTSLLVADDGAVWAGTRRAGGEPEGAQGGVWRFDGEQWTSWTTRNGLASNDVEDVAVDDSGTVWAATDRGVSRFDGSDWVTYTTTDGLAHNEVSAVVVGPAGAVWAGTNDGLSRFDGDGWASDPTALNLNEPLANGLVSHLATGPDDIWASALVPSGTGLSRFDGQEWTGLNEGLNIAVFELSVGDEGTVWVGTSSSGLARLDRPG